MLQNDTAVFHAFAWNPLKAEYDDWRGMGTRAALPPFRRWPASRRSRSWPIMTPAAPDSTPLNRRPHVRDNSSTSRFFRKLLVPIPKRSTSP